MNLLETHVDILFRGYGHSRQIQELKDEIMGNLEDRAADLTAEGMDYEEAVKRVVRDLGPIDSLIDGSTDIYVNRYRVELLQRALIFTLVAWIITIPLRIVAMGTVLSLSLLLACIAMGIALLVLTRRAHQCAEFLRQVARYNIHRAKRYRSIAWMLWALYMFVTTLATTAVFFGSNLWFSRPIHIDGPYQFSLLMIRYALPFISILLPLLARDSFRLIEKYEVGEEDGYQE